MSEIIKMKRPLTSTPVSLFQHAYCRNFEFLHLKRAAKVHYCRNMALRHPTAQHSSVAPAQIGCLSKKPFFDQNSIGMHF
ncbi:hypothetical protein IJT93_13230 [bacterium]|nr:hypothetical protein [bacterium]